MLPVNYDPQQRINRTFSNEVFMEKSLVEKIGAVLKSTLYVLFVLIMLCAIFLLVLSTTIDSRNIGDNEDFGEPLNPEEWLAWTERIAQKYRDEDISDHPKMTDAMEFLPGAIGKIFSDSTVCQDTYKNEYQPKTEPGEEGTAEQISCRNKINWIIKCNPTTEKGQDNCTNLHVTLEN